MKKLIAILLVCLLLTACGTAPVRVRDMDDDEKENDRRPLAETAIASTAPVDYGTVTFDHHYEMQEWAVITCTNQDGSIRWQVETDHYEAAQLNQVVEIGQYQDRYYFIDESQVVALRMSDGTELWRVAEHVSEPVDDCIFVDDKGTIYLSGFFGPDLIVVDTNGSILMHAEQLSEDYYWPCRLEVDTDTGKATVYMTGGPDGDMGSENAYPITVDLP